MTRVLVTGGAGYIGCVLVPMLLEKGFHVRVFDNLKYGQCVLLDHFINDRFEFIKGDITNENDVQKAMNQVDVVVHLCAIVGAPACQIDPTRAEAVNVEGTRNVNRSRKGAPIIFPSTTSIYGYQDSLCTEDSPIHPLSHYAITKYEAEKIVTASENFVVFRPATAFGLSPRMRLDLLVNDFTYQAVKARSLVVYEGNARRTFVHVRDFARAICFAIDNFDRMKGQIFNLGSEKLNISKKELTEIILKYQDYYIHFAEFGSDPDKRDYEVSYARLRSKGFDVTYDFHFGVKELIKGYSIICMHTPHSNYVR
ncbi:NAD(P)-dependent oxidoreductase [Candidatus Sumerlaeota bacterium]|nr:NAD(P)-dependent oxidoreductase [Candidatus Sumerlaeota bacterium]